MSKKKLSKDQKRKKKLAERAKRSNDSDRVQAYEGNRYKTDEYLPLIFATEKGILESYVISDRTLTDRDVERSINYLVKDLRGEAEPGWTGPIAADWEGQETDLIVVRIKENWLAEDCRSFTKEDKIGVLRTLLSSIGCWGHPGSDSQGYLQYVENFMQQFGLRLRAVHSLSPVRAEEERPWDEEIEEEEDEEADIWTNDENNPRVELYELAYNWQFEGDRGAERAFIQRCLDLLKKGEKRVVLEVCERLITVYPRIKNELGFQEIMRKSWT